MKIEADVLSNSTGALERDSQIFLGIHVCSIVPCALLNIIIICANQSQGKGL